MKLIRVLVANQPRLMRELVLATMSDQPDIEIVGQVDNDAGVRAAVESTSPDFLIVALDSSDQLSKPFAELLVTHPRLKILGIAPSRDATICYWLSMEIRSNRIESSEEGIVCMIALSIPLSTPSRVTFPLDVRDTPGWAPKTIRVRPTRSWSPTFSGAVARTRPPLTYVPFALPRS